SCAQLSCPFICHSLFPIFHLPLRQTSFDQWQMENDQRQMANETGQGINNTFPVVFLPSSCRCASAASRSGNVFSILSFNSPDLIQLNRSPARQSNSSFVAAYCARLGRVKKSEPFCASSAGSNAATGPLDWPKSANIPRGASDDRLFKNVSRPTES